MAISRLLARPLLASSFVVGGISALRTTEDQAVKAKPVTDRIVALAQRAGVPMPEDPATLVRINAGVQIAAGLALATGRAPRISAFVLAGSVVPTTIAGHAFWAADSPAERKRQIMQFSKNLSMLGGLLIASGDTEGRPGVAWRARRAAKDARREARHFASTARREAALAKAKVT